ncbi:putative T7SS-secreted protein [Kitasatospora sp. NPDC049258]|uniref:WXG100 family type VII secretion target n=1 Tax=Kitasatospora sp. NPDC049258 TaxID=3155394 RepID=UPI00344035B5
MSDAADFPALGFDPAPGNPGSVDTLVTRLNTAAGALESAHQSLSSLTRVGGSWQGDAAQAFAAKVTELPGLLQDSDDAVRTAAQQLNSWRGQLVSFQDTARRYEVDARAAKQRCEQCEAAKDRADSRYNSAADAPAFRLGGQFFTDDAQLKEAQARIDAAQRELEVAGAELDDAKHSLEDAKDAFEAIVKQAKELKEDHQDAAEKVAKALRKANQNAPSTSMWDKFKDSLKRAGHAIKEWATKHADLLKKIGDWMSIASTVLGVAALCTAWFPPLAGALALAGGVMSAGALATHGLAKLGGADVGAMDLIGDGLGILPAGKFFGTALKGGTKVATKLVPKVVNGVRSSTEVVREVGKAQLVRQLGNATRGSAVRVSRLVDEGTDIVTDFKALPGFGNRMKLAWQTHVGVTAGESMFEGLKTSKLAQLPVLRDIPSLKAAIRADGSLDPMSWWSRGPLAAAELPGIATDVYDAVTGG